MTSTFFASGRFGGPRPPVLPVAAEPSSTLQTPGSSAEPSQQNAEASTIGMHTEEAPGAEIPAESAPIPEAEPPGQVPEPEPAPKPKRATRPRKRPPAETNPMLIVVHDGTVTASCANIVIINIDTAAADTTDAAAVVDLITALKPTSDSELRTRTLETLKDLVAKKALA